MLFNSYFFILIFLPLTVAGFFVLGRLGMYTCALGWMVGASLFFYAWINPAYLMIILASILFNYYWGLMVTRGSRILLAIGIAVNLAGLGYFKYANFFLDNLRAMTGIHVDMAPVFLPLAISFYTFQQIAYLVDAHEGKTREDSFLNYCLFVTFFPRLMQGPIVYHKEMMPQFVQKAIFHFNPQNVAVGLTVFFFGLFKKVIIADGLARYATPVFDAAEQQYVLSFMEAWEGALAYTLQIYFDFSGYSDMAIGLAYLFGIRIALNFNSPYKSASVIDFWRRWHISLSRFLRDYLYIPLGGNRKGDSRRWVNILITMLLGGLWHGAAWTFVLWGGLHGVFLVINHNWRKVKQRFHYPSRSGRLGHLCGCILTFLSVTIAWVFFRADNTTAALHIIKSMAGQNGFALPERYLVKFATVSLPLQQWGVDFRQLRYFEGSNDVAYIAIALLIVWFAPNVQQMMNRYQPYLNAMGKEGKLPDPPEWLMWQPSVKWALALVACAFVALLLLSRATEFLYFQF